jgi:hypothetical protein
MLGVTRKYPSLQRLAGVTVLAASVSKCPDGDKACINRCMSKSQIKGVVWSDATRACIRACRIQNAANEVILGCVSGCLDRMVR